MTLMDAKLAMSQDSYQHSQLTWTARFELGGERVCREYQANVVVCNTYGNECLRRSHQILVYPMLWEALPMSSRTVRLKHLAFRMSYRSRGSVKEVFIDAHQEFPKRLFELLNKLERIHQLLTLPHCLRGRFASTLSKLYCGGFETNRLERIWRGLRDESSCEMYIGFVGFPMVQRYGCH